VANAHGVPVIYLVATSGHPNFGDELITAAWLRQLARTHPGAEVWVDTPRPGQSAVLHGALHPRVRFVDTLYHACWNAPSDNAAEILDYGRAVVDNPGLIPREATGVEDLAQVDLIHVIGGSYLNNHWPRHLAMLSAAAQLAVRHGTRTALTGTTMTPFVPDSLELLGEILGGFDVVDVRDRLTAEALGAKVDHLTHTGDDAFLGLNLQRQDRLFPAKTLISVQSDFLTVSMEALASGIVTMLQAWGVDQDPVTLVECLPPDDTAIATHLTSHVPQLGVLPFSSLWRNGIPANPRGRWITTRFHTHLMGAAAGAWGVILPAGGDYAMVDPGALLDAGSGWALAPDLQTPVPVSRRVGVPFDGRLASLQEAKQAVAQRVSSLVAGP
jgi:hypothetical protein